MSSKTITDVNTSFITYISGCHVDARKNPIDYNENDLKNTSKWKKYINKIHKLIIGDKFPSMCLVRKTNNTYYYKSNYSCDDFKVVFECRFEGVRGNRVCSAVIYNCSNKIFSKTCKTPKRLYHNLMEFTMWNNIEIRYLNRKRLTGTFVFTDMYAYLLKNGSVKSFVSDSDYVFTK